MSEQMMGCPNYKLGLCNNDECSHWGEHKWNAFCLSRGDCRNCVCIPIPNVEPPQELTITWDGKNWKEDPKMSKQLWICDHAETCNSKKLVWCSKPFDGMFRGGNVYSNTPCELHGEPHPIPKAIPYEPQEAPQMSPEYELIKNVSIRALDEAGACERELHRFAFLVIKELFDGAYRCELTDDCAVRVASQCEGGIRFLLENGFIKEKAVTYSIGQRFKCGDEYILCACGETGWLALVNLYSGATRNKRFRVDDVSRVSHETLYKNFGEDFELIEQ